MTDQDKKTVRADNDYDQCKMMLEHMPDSASMYVEAISNRTFVSEKDVLEIIKGDIK